MTPYRWMIAEALKGNLRDAYDRSTGEWNATKIAEAYFADHRGEEDGEHSPVWDVAIEASEYLQAIKVKG